MVVSSAFAESPYDGAYGEYPKHSYIMGIGEVEKTENLIKDKRVAEVLARAEIARQIKVRLKEETIDIACEGTPGKVLGGHECKNVFLMVIEQSVDEVLVGSRIVRTGEHDGIVYAVAILPRKQTVKELDRNLKESLNKAKESIERAKKGDKSYIERAQKDYMKAFTYKKEKEAIQGEGHSSDLLEELEREIVKLRKD
jgi:hypothetical protein